MALMITSLPASWAVGPEDLPSQPKSIHHPTTTPAGTQQPAGDLEYERKLESSKRKLERGYAAHEEARKRSKVIVLDLGGPVKKEEVVDDEDLLPLGPIVTATAKKQPCPARTHGRDQAKAKAATAAGETKARPKPPRWYLRLKKEREEARIRSLLLSEIKEQQRRRRAMQMAANLACVYY